MMGAGHKSTTIERMMQTSWPGTLQLFRPSQGAPRWLDDVDFKDTYFLK
jgi:hypothetical protein